MEKKIIIFSAVVGDHHTDCQALVKKKHKEQMYIYSLKNIYTYIHTYRYVYLHVTCTYGIELPKLKLSNWRDAPLLLACLDIGS